MKKIFAILLIFVLALCGCNFETEAEQEQENSISFPKRPMLCFEGVYYVNPYLPLSELPAGYEYAGTISKEMAYNTGLEGIEFYTNPEMSDFFTYQETGTPVGNNIVDSENRGMFYVQWVPLANE